MAFDWEKFKRDTQQDSKEAAAETNAKLASQISSVTRLTDEEINSLCPTPADKARLAELLAVVKAATDRNQKIAKLQTDIGRYGGIIVDLLARAV